MNRSVRQFLSLGHRVETPDGVHFVFMNVAAPVLIPFILVMSLTFAFGSRSATPLLLLLATPLCFVKPTWKFQYRGPTVERDLTMFGWSFWTQSHPLRQGDRAVVEPTVFGRHPPSYRLTLWSIALNTDRWVARSSGPEGLQSLECTAELFNEAIEKVLQGSPPGSNT